MDIVWYESKGNLNWTEVLKTIREDVSGFVADGGFEIFLGEETAGTATGEADDSDSDENDDEYKEVGIGTLSIVMGHFVTFILGHDIYNCQIASSESSDDFSDGGGSDSDEGSNESDDDDDESLVSHLPICFYSTFSILLCLFSILLSLFLHLFSSSVR